MSVSRAKSVSTKPKFLKKSWMLGSYWMSRGWLISISLALPDVLRLFSAFRPRWKAPLAFISSIHQYIRTAKGWKPGRKTPTSRPWSAHRPALSGHFFNLLMVISAPQFLMKMKNHNSQDYLVWALHSPEEGLLSVSPGREIWWANTRRKVFLAVAPFLWNILPKDSCLAPSSTAFMCQVKTGLYWWVFHWIS